MASTPDLDVFAAGRHPVLGENYVPETHRYTDEYLSPKKYRLIIRAFQGFDPEEEVEDREPPQGGPEQPTKLKVIRLRLPEDTVAFDYVVKSADRAFLKKLTKPISSLVGRFNIVDRKMPWFWELDVPGPARYEISVTIRNRGGGGPTKTLLYDLRDFVVVSIGDSAASGQGNPDIPGVPEEFELPRIHWWNVFAPQEYLYRLTVEAIDWSWDKILTEMPTIARAGGFSIDMDPSPIWLEPNAYRSLRSGHAFGAAALQKPEEGTLVTFLPFGRSGSTILEGLINPRSGGDSWIDGLGQIDEVARTLGGRRIDALLIYIGVNDVGVAASLTNLVLGDDALISGLAGGGAPPSVVEKMALENLARLPADFNALWDEIATKLNVRHVYITEYPTGLFDDGKGVPRGGCEIFASDLPLNLDTKDAELIMELSEKLNTALREAVDAANKRPSRAGEPEAWFYVSGVAEAFRTHGYCRPADAKWFVTATESLAAQGDTEGTIHPNSRGHKEIGKAVRQAIENNGSLKAPETWLESALHSMMA